jgi:glycosyltransferase involved in cell wall biosynthesis
MMTQRSPERSGDHRSVPGAEGAGQVSLSLVIPVFNERDNIGPLYTRLSEVLRELGQSYEIIFVDDGSADDTFRLVHDLHRDDAHIRVVRLRRNFGQTPAMSAGIDVARGDIVITMDGDLQNDPADIPRLLDKMAEGYDVVSGWRAQRQDTFLTRILPSKIANWIIGIITGVRIHDYGCTMKAYRAGMLKSVHLYAEMHRFIPAMVTIAGAGIGELVVKHHPRKYGQSKYGISRIGRVLLDLITVKLLIRFSPNPAHWFGVFSVPFWLLGLFFGIWSIRLTLTMGTAYFPIVIPALCFLMFFSAAYLVLLGLLSELVVKTGSYSIAQVAGR